MKPLTTLVLSGLLAAGLTAPALAQAPALATFPVGSTTVTVSELTPGLDVVWELAWGPDNFLWMTERRGRISRVNPATGQVLPLLSIPDVSQQAEGGLLGMVLHPRFAAQPYLYVVYNYLNNGQYREKVVRYTYDVATNTLGSPLALLANIPANLYHNGSRLIILPDETLLMTTGDANVSADAQNPASLSGKSLRMNLDGSIPVNNPTPGSYVYTLGHRNPQGLVQLPSGRIYSSEHGTTTDDEVNLLEPGRNYGWPNVQGMCDEPGEMAFCSANNVREPLTTWTPTVAPAALKYYNHPAIPEWQGSLLLACLGGNLLAHLPLNASGDAITGRTYYMRTYGRLRALCVSPTGKVYIGTSNSNTDRILVLENRAFLASARPASGLDFKLWPNPAQQQATLELPAAGLSVQVRDLLGRELLALQPATTTATLNLSTLRPGTYLVQASGAAGTATRRLVVK
ncbi:PQQ-dependent sugar dehydrogenase [Hymenobacter saemangeumensis]